MTDCLGGPEAQESRRSGETAVPGQNPRKNPFRRLFFSGGLWYNDLNLDRPGAMPGGTGYGTGGGDDDERLIHRGGAVSAALQVVGYRAVEDVPLRHGRADRPGGAGTAETDGGLDGLGGIRGHLHPPDGPLFAGSPGSADPHRGHLPPGCGPDGGYSHRRALRGVVKRRKTVYDKGTIEI